MRLFRRSKAPEVTQQNGQTADRRGDDKEVKMSPKNDGKSGHKKGDDVNVAPAEHNDAGRSAESRQDEKVAVARKGDVKEDGEEKSSYANVTSLSIKGRRGERAPDGEGSTKQPRPWNLVVSNKPWNPTKASDHSSHPDGPKDGESVEKKEDSKHKRDTSVPKASDSTTTTSASPTAQETKKGDADHKKQVVESTAAGQPLQVSAQEWDNSTSEAGNSEQKTDSVQKERGSFSARRNESTRNQDKVHSFRNAESARKYESREQPHGFSEGESQQDASKKGATYDSRYPRGKFKKQSEFRQRYRSESPRNDYKGALKKNLDGPKIVNRAHAGSRTTQGPPTSDIADTSVVSDAKPESADLPEPAVELPPPTSPPVEPAPTPEPEVPIDTAAKMDEATSGASEGVDANNEQPNGSTEDSPSAVDPELENGQNDDHYGDHSGQDDTAPKQSLESPDGPSEKESHASVGEEKVRDLKREEDFPRTKDFTYKPTEFKRSAPRDKNMDLVHQDGAGDSSTVQDYKSRITKGKPFYPPKNFREEGGVPTSHITTSNVYIHHDGYKPSEGGPRRKRVGHVHTTGEFDGPVYPYLPKHAEYTYYPMDPQEYAQYATLQPIDATYGVQYVRNVPVNVSQGYVKESQDDGQPGEQTAYSGQVTYNGQSAVSRPKIKPRKNAALQILNPETGEVVNSETRKEQRKTPKPPENAQTSTWQYNPYLNPYVQQAYVRPQYPSTELLTNTYLPHEIPDSGGFTVDEGVLDGIHMPIQFPLQRRTSIESRGSFGSLGGHKGFIQAGSSNSGSIDGGTSEVSLDGGDKTLLIASSKYAQVMQNQHAVMAGQYAVYRDAHVRIKNKPIAPTESIFTLSEQHPLSTRSTGRRKTKIANEPVQGTLNVPESIPEVRQELPPLDQVSQDKPTSLVEAYERSDVLLEENESVANGVRQANGDHGTVLEPVSSIGPSDPSVAVESTEVSPGDVVLPIDSTSPVGETEEGESIDSLLRFAFSMKICPPEELGFFKLVPLNYQIESPREPKVTRAKKKKNEKWRSDPPPEIKKVKMTKEEQFTRTVRTLLNKLTVEKFLTVGEKVALVYQELDSPVLVDILVRLLHEKATTEIDYSDMYADLALLLKYKFNDSLDIGFRSTCFQRTLLNRCQDAFEEISRTCKSQNEASATNEEDPSLPSKKWVLGNIRFMGELFLRKILSIAILKRIFGTLLCRDQVPSEHLMECFTELLTTIGFTMEKIPGGPEMLDEYMKILQGLRTSGVYSTRISFKIQDLMDLRTKNWKKKLFREKATTVDEIHSQARVEELKGGSIHAEQEGRFTTAGLRADRHYSAHLQTLREQAQSLLVDGVYKGPSSQSTTSHVPTNVPGLPTGATVEQKKADVWEDVLEIFIRRPSRGVFVDEWKKIGVEENDKPRVFRLMCQKATYASTLEVSCALAELAALVITALTESQATLHKLIDTLSIQFLERLQDEMLDNPRALLIFSRILIALFCECSNRRELLEMLIFPQDEQLAQELAEEVVKGVKERNGDVSFTKMVIDKVCKVEI